MKIKFFYGLILILTSLSLGAEPAESSLPRPKLVVGIVVDQMRWDYLYRYYDRYGDRGFKRLLKEGFTCENTQLNYLPAFTAVGHTCIYTGSVPSVTGIAANDFYIEKEKKKLYCTADPTVECVGSDSQAGRMSPRNLWVTTITDELRLGTNFHSKVIGIALKDRAAILPAGHTANAAYWFDYDSGKWITSSYYTDKLPRWVEDFNARDRASQLLQQDWNTLYPIGTYKQSTKDDTPYEAPFIKGEKPVFPIPTSKLLKTNGYSMIRQTPYGNTFTLEMAKTAVEKEEMGQREETDFLAVSLSATDYIGHQFGTNAIETEDTYLRLDQDLGLFFEFLDEKIGRDHYTVFLTADHAAAHNVGFLQSHRIPSDSWLYQKVLHRLDSTLNNRFAVQGLVYSLDNYQVHLDRQLISRSRLAYETVKSAVLDYLNNLEVIAYAVDMEKVAISTLPTGIREKIINGYCRERSGAIQIIVKPGWYESGTPTPQGTTHGTWHSYDTHVPLLFMGWGIRQGATRRLVGLTDIAPTIAALLHIQAPNGCIGQPIPEILK